MCSGLISKSDPPLTSFRQFNTRLRQLFQFEDDWDKEFEVLNEFNGHSQFSMIRDNDEDDEDDDDDDEEIEEELPLSSRQLNF